MGLRRKGLVLVGALVLVGVLAPRRAAANELRCILDAKDDDDMDDCAGRYDRPVARVGMFVAAGAGPGAVTARDAAIHVTSLWSEAGGRPFAENPVHVLRHVWLDASLPVSTATYGDARPTGHGAAVGNAQVSVSYEDDSLRGMIALALPTGRGTPGSRWGDIQEAAAAAWGYERNPSFAAGRVGLVGGVDLDTASRGSGLFATLPERFRAGVSLHVQGLIPTPETPSARSGLDVVPEARLAWTPYRVVPYEVDALRTVAVLLRTWSDVRVEPISSAARLALFGEARLELTLVTVRPSIGVTFPLAVDGARVVSVHSGLAMYF